MPGALRGLCGCCTHAHRCLCPAGQGAASRESCGLPGWAGAAGLSASLQEEEESRRREEKRQAERERREREQERRERELREAALREQRYPEPVCQQSAHPREVFKQKERGVPTSSVSSPQPGDKEERARRTCPPEGSSWEGTPGPRCPLPALHLPQQRPSEKEGACGCRMQSPASPDPPQPLSTATHMGAASGGRGACSAHLPGPQRTPAWSCRPAFPQHVVLGAAWSVLVCVRRGVVPQCHVRCLRQAPLRACRAQRRLQVLPLPAP